MENPYESANSETNDKTSKAHWIVNAVFLGTGAFFLGMTIFIFFNTRSASKAWETSQKDVKALGEQLAAKDRELNEARYEQSRLHDFVHQSKRQGVSGVSVSGNRVSAPTHQFLLFRTAFGVGAIQFTPVTAQGDKPVDPIPGTARIDHMKYSWYYTSKRFAESLVEGPFESQQGEVFDLAEPPSPGGARRQTSIQLPEFNVQWSPGNWLRLPDNLEFEFAGTEATRLEDINPNDRQLVWIGRRH
ncbi:MAG: hypothetical protein AB8G99_04890 [Planctomycetaceae bacterium]